MIDPATRAFYDREAESLGELSPNAPADPELMRFAGRLYAGSEVLDLGCGAGLAALHFARSGHRVTGLDASAGLLNLARGLVPGGRFVQAGFDALEDEDAYDAVWAHHALHHAPRDDFPFHLAAIARALRAGGLFHIAMLVGGGTMRDGHGRIYTFYGIDELRGLLETAGFEILDQAFAMVTGVNGVPAQSVAFTAIRSAAT